MRDLATYRRLAELELAGMPDGEASSLPGLILAIAFCDSLGQLATWPLGFVAWLRCSLEHTDLLRLHNFDALRRLSRQELTTGSVLYVAETYTSRRGAAGIAARELSRLPGVERFCWDTWNRRLGVRRWHEWRVRPRPQIEAAA